MKTKPVLPDGNVKPEEHGVSLVTGGSHTHHTVTFHFLLKFHGAWNLWLLFLISSFVIKVLSTPSN